MDADPEAAPRLLESADGSTTKTTSIAGGGVGVGGGGGSLLTTNTVDDVHQAQPTRA